MEMIRLTDSIVEYLLISSTLLLILGALSSLILRGLKIQGSPKLWIFILLLVMPLTYPLKTFFPGPIKVPIPLKTFESINFQSFNEITPDNSNLNDLPYQPKDRISDNQIVLNETTSKEHEILNADSINRLKKNRLKLPVGWKSIAILIWGLVFLYFLMRLITIVYNTNRLFKLADSVTDPQVLKLLQQSVVETRLHRIPQLLIVDNISAPMVMGFFKPWILIPRHLLKKEFREGLHFALLHELKHIHQHHNWWMFIESIIGAVYFFHPVIHWAKNKIHTELELICDRHVVQLTNKSTSYADFLLHEIWQQSCKNKSAMGLPFISGATKTTNRVHSILENVRPTLFAKIRSKVALGLFSMVFLSLLLCSFVPYHGGQHKELVLKNNPSTSLAEEGFSQENIIPLKIDVTSIRPDNYEKETATAFQEEMTEKQSIENVNPSIVIANEAYQNEIRPDKQLKSDSAEIIVEPVSIINTEDIIASLLQKEPATKVALDKSARIETLAQKYLGSSVRGITIHRVDNMRALDEQTILFITLGDKLYLTRLAEPCHALLFTDDFGLESSTAQITKFDRIHAMSGNQIMGSSGMLGDFYPYKYEGSKAEAIKLLKNGLLKELVAEDAFQEVFSVKS